MRNLKSKDWWISAGTRAIRTFAQTMVATVGTSATLGDVNWIMVFSASALSALLSLCMSLAGLPEVSNNDQEGGMAE